MTFSTAVKKVVLRAWLAVQKPFCEEVLVLGDSHAKVFGHPLMRLTLGRYHLNVVSVGGATASSLENPNSKTQAFQRFKQALATTRAEKVVVMLGEVDTGFVIWYRADKSGVTAQEAFERALLNYRRLLSEIRERGLTPICVSTPLPTIQDGAPKGAIANARKSVTVSQQERTELTLRFNLEMERFCCAESIAYLNLDADSLGSDGLVKTELLNRDPLDHHYERRVHARMLSEHVKPIVRTSGVHKGRSPLKPRVSRRLPQGRPRPPTAPL